MQRLLLLLPCEALARPLRDIWKCARRCLFSFFLEVAPVRCSLCAAEVLTGGFLTSHGPEFLAAAQRLQLLLRLLFSAPLPPLRSSAAGKVIFLSRVAVTRWPRHPKAPDSFSLRQSVILAFKPLSVTSWF